MLTPQRDSISNSLAKGITRTKRQIRFMTSDKEEGDGTSSDYIDMTDLNHHLLEINRAVELDEEE